MDEQTNTVVGLMFTVVMGAITWITIFKCVRTLNNPSDNTTLYLEPLSELSVLHHEGKYQLRALRQSSNLKKDDLDTVIKVAKGIFKRTKNTRTKQFIKRPYFREGGHAQGKKQYH